jgi:hypothetical protein
MATATGQRWSGVDSKEEEISSFVLTLLIPEDDNEDEDENLEKEMRLRRHFQQRPRQARKRIQSRCPSSAKRSSAYMALHAVFPFFY